MFHGPLFHYHARVHTRRALADAGYTGQAVDEAIGELDGETIDAVAADTGVQFPAVSSVEPGRMGAIGDGSILKAIMAFFQSPQGQALIAALMQMLLGFLMPKTPAPA